MYGYCQSATSIIVVFQIHHLLKILDVQNIFAKLPCAPGTKYSGEQHILGYDDLGTKVRLDIRLDIDNNPNLGAEPKRCLHSTAN